MAGGRPSEFGQWKDILIRMAEQGLTDAQMCSVIGKEEQTLANWKNKYPKFFESLKTAKEDFDQQVEKSLLQRALGYKYKEEASTREGVIELEKYSHADTTACIFWLKNRQPQRWREKQEIEHSGTMGITIIDDIK